MKKVEVGIVGAAGYTAGELLRLLIHHPQVRIAWAQSESQKGKPVSAVHQDLLGETELHFTGTLDMETVDVIFLCKGHGESEKLISSHPQLLKTRIIDLSQDFRLAGTHDFVYGLPEINRQPIARAKHIANPGCFATALQMAILPAISEDIVASDIHLSGITGSTGAGQSFSKTSHFSWRNGNASVYKPLTHQHLQETGETVANLNPRFSGEINFMPYRGSFTRGIIVSAYFHTSASAEELQDIYQSFYGKAAFTHYSEENPDLKMVLNTNKAVVHTNKIDNKAMVISVIDNLLKGASGQALQNMNILFDLDEKTGLHLKPSGF